MAKRYKQGYLEGDYRIFRLQTPLTREVPFHYHDFHKIILFLDGAIDYVIEGRRWSLRPHDLVLVAAGQMHRPIAGDAGVPYKRLVIYVSPDFLARWSAREPSGDDLAACFAAAQKEGGVMHQTAARSHDLLFHMERTLRIAKGEGFANQLYTELAFVEFLILVNRSMQRHELDALKGQAADPKIEKMLTYIGEHLDGDLRVETLAQHIYLSPYHLMRKFKAETGMSLHHYVLTRRLQRARELLRTDDSHSIAEIAEACGFRDYSTFSRAFRSAFHITPKDIRN